MTDTAISTRASFAIGVESSAVNPFPMSTNLFTLYGESAQDSSPPPPPPPVTRITGHEKIGDADTAQSGDPRSALAPPPSSSYYDDRP